MASKSKWKKRALKRAALIVDLQNKVSQALNLNEQLRAQTDYHRQQHSRAAEALQLATTSPDTKAAHEEGFKSGVAHAQRLAVPAPGAHHGDERAVNFALLPALTAMADADAAFDRAQIELNGAMAKIGRHFNPPPPEDDAENVVSFCGCVPPCEGHHEDDD